MTTKPKRLTAEQEANAIDHKAKTSGQHPDVLEMDIAAALRKRDELYAKAWAECAVSRNAEQLLMDGHSDPATMVYTETLAMIPTTRATHDAARKAAGLEDA